VGLPQQLLLSDLLRLRVRCDQGLEHGAGLQGWMHPPVHRLLGWASKPSAFGSRRLVWRLNQLRGLTDLEAMVEGEPAETDQATLDRLPTLFDAALIGRDGVLLGSVADAAVDLSSGRILHYLVSRSDPRLPGSSRWRLTPERIVDQQPGQVITDLNGLDDLPLAKASVRQQLLRRSRRWREQVQQAGGRFEERLEGWLEEPPWEEPSRPVDQSPEPREARAADAWDDWDWSGDSAAADAVHDPNRPRRRQDLDPDHDPWV
jgi:sporulation protein YlmC with PRC-barrel domain